MAVEKLPISSGLRLAVQTGVDENGDPVVVNRNFNRLKPAASDEAGYAVAEKLAALQLYPLMWIQRTDQAQLMSV
ncbi:MAG: DUF1659 domain-containing protein [Bacillota bacterium]|nr:DUF1659 domain-containing protein [Bacillota bacterium]